MTDLPPRLAERLAAAAGLHRQGRLAEAERGYRDVLAEAPQTFDALQLLALATHQRGDAAAAVALFRRAVALHDGHSATHANLAAALRDLRRPAEALAACDRAIALQPVQADAWANRGAALLDLRRPGEALASFEHALVADPVHVPALYNRGNALRELGRPAQALASYDRALALDARHREALNNRGNALRELGRPQDAVAAYERLLALAPGDVAALANRGAALLDLHRPRQALESFEAALAAHPDPAAAHAACGLALLQLGRAQDALARCDRALALQPGRADALHHRGDALLDLKRGEEALASYAAALAVEPRRPFLFGAWLHLKMALCDWHGLGDAFDALARGIEQGLPLAAPFALLATPLSPALQRQCAAACMRHAQREAPGLPAIPRRTERSLQSSDPLEPSALSEPPEPLQPSRPPRRLRVGYFSADFHDHVTVTLMAGLFERHDRTRFEPIAFSLSPRRDDAMRRRLEAAFERFVDTEEASDADIARQARRLGIDIAVDLNGFSRGGRPGVFVQRAAPVQVAYLGYAGTTGAAGIDYVLADAVVIGPADAAHYPEKIVRLPGSYQVNDDRRAPAPPPPGRAQAGLPEEGFVFCCFNNPVKITPDVFDVWMRLLARCEGSVLWLFEGHAGTASRRLKAEAARRGVDGGRLVFAPFTAAPPAHLARLQLADLFVDTLHYNAHGTASDALWAGVPVLTCQGATFAGRVGASLLKAVGLPELVTQSAAEYEALALALAADRPRLAALRTRLAANRRTQPLFDTGRTTRHVEAAYLAMWARYAAGLAPEHIDLSSGVA